MDSLNGYRGHKAGFCEKNLFYGQKLYLKPMRKHLVFLGFYCGTRSGFRVVQMKNSMLHYIDYAPAFAATEDELLKWWY